MIITAIETLVCHARTRNWLLVKIVTDNPGLYGWGEAALERRTRAVVGAIEDVAQPLIGEDPRRIEHLWQMICRQHFWHGNGILRGTAISGIDIAPWDILGKVHGVPVRQPWGRPVRDCARFCCHLGGGKKEDFYNTDPADAKRFDDLARQAVEDGFTAFKRMAVPETMPLEGNRPVHYAEACVRAMRDAKPPHTPSPRHIQGKPGPPPQKAISPQNFAPVGRQAPVQRRGCFSITMSSR